MIDILADKARYKSKLMDHHLEKHIGRSSSDQQIDNEESIFKTLSASKSSAVFNGNQTLESRRDELLKVEGQLNAQLRSS